MCIHAKKYVKKTRVSRTPAPSRHSKLIDITYNKFQIQPYLTTKEKNNSGKELLFNLRSNCHSSKYNFRKINKNNTNCVFKCPHIEDQRHSFTQCTPILNNISNAYTTTYEDIYGTLIEQTKSTIIFIKNREKEESLQEVSSPTWGKSMPVPLHIWVHYKWCSRHKCLIAV